MAKRVTHKYNVLEMNNLAKVSFTSWISSIIIWFWAMSSLPSSVSQTNYFATFIHLLRPLLIYVGIASFYTFVISLVKTRKYSDDSLKLIQIVSITSAAFGLLLNYFAEHYPRSFDDLVAIITAPLILLLFGVSCVFFFVSMVILFMKRKMNALFFINLLLVAYPSFLIAILILFISLGFGPPS